jgi:regulator of replication initiation timing
VEKLLKDESEIKNMQNLIDENNLLLLEKQQLEEELRQERDKFTTLQQQQTLQMADITKQLYENSQLILQ